MTLATHAIVGTAAASLAPASPLLALALAFGSHLLIDTIPHRDYRLLSLVKGERKIDNDMRFGRLFVYDLMRTGTDALIGATLSVLIFAVLIFQLPLHVVALGIVGGLLPDFLQLVYFKTRSRLLVPLQRFHIWIQKGRELDEAPLWVGVGLQVGIVTVIIIAMLTLRT